MARRFATRIGAIRANRFARIDSQKNPYFHNVRAIRANRLKPAIRNFWPSRSAIRKKGVRFGDPETIRENQAIRANLRIDSRESGHLSLRALLGNVWCSMTPPGVHLSEIRHT